MNELAETVVVGGNMAMQGVGTMLMYALIGGTVIYGYALVYALVYKAIKGVYP